MTDDDIDNDPDFNIWGDEYGSVHAGCKKCRKVITYGAGDINWLSELVKLCKEHTCG